MKRRFTAILLLATMVPVTLLAGGIVTNTNQSASFIRMPVQDATLSIDGAYYNPAGLVHLQNGFHISVSNQYVSQTRTIESDYALLKNKEYTGDVLAPLFPTFYAVYKMDKLAFAFNVNPIGGGGSANFTTGLPSFEYTLSGIPTILQQQLLPLDQTAEALLGTDPGFRNITGYNVDVAFDASSLNWGFQLGAAYAINDMISISLGARYIMAKNTYKGHLKDYMINAPAEYGGTQTPGNYLRTVATIVEPLSPPTATALNAQAAVLDVATADQEVDDSQSGSGISPIVGLNFKISEQLNIGLKYEHKAAIKVKHEVGKDALLYADGTEIDNDMPSLISLGASFKPIEKFNIAVGCHYYLDKSANYGKRIDGVFVENKEVIDKNFLEVGVGFEYLVTNNILLSLGYLRTQTGVNDKYHNDQAHSLNTNSIGVGGKYMVNENIGINLGFMTTMYEPYTKEYPANLDSFIFQPYEETYNRSAMVIALGLDFKF
jgi:long-subunit fatty acid transport protein